MKHNNKKIIIIKTIAIFLSLFLFSNMYRWIPNFVTATIFPVNESLFEHLKMIYTCEIIVSLIIYLILKYKNIKIYNYFLALLIGTVFDIILFYLITLKDNKPLYNKISLIVIPIIWIILFYFTFNPIETKFFFDPIKEVYGIPYNK